MFPTLVWKLQLKAEFHQPMDERILAALEKEGLPRVAAGKGWQSEQNLHQLGEFRDLVACVERGTRSVLRFLRIGCDAFEITGCWANVLTKGASHRAHTHPNNFLSGAYYLCTPAGADTINFHDPRPQAGIIRPPVNGTLLLFPAYLQHSVDANASEEPRISISFNVMFSGFAENLSKPLW
ncbi:MAG: 2OG-Fe(II) oxygenase family protein [Betaproteobacteria bacterium]|nr:2OG-Fe(II) oxygenase family protein [Betaproteobacteria bacterium]